MATSESDIEFSSRLAYYYPIMLGTVSDKVGTAGSD